jgi:hypothetical protein
MNLYIYGHSIRIITPDSDWTEIRRDEFLIRNDVVSPKSVDTNVWAEFVHDEVQTDVGLLPLPVWSSRDKMLGISKYAVGRTDLVELTIGVLIEDVLPEFIDLNGFSIVDSIDGNFLGYDVADEGLTSALSNCGYSSKDILEARLHFSNAINNNGLIASLDAAKEFVKYSTSRIPDHAPFFIFLLYSDKDI